MVSCYILYNYYNFTVTARLTGIASLVRLPVGRLLLEGREIIARMSERAAQLEALKRKKSSVAAERERVLRQLEEARCALTPPSYCPGPLAFDGRGP